jgi:hypothetical protein
VRASLYKASIPMKAMAPAIPAPIAADEMEAAPVCSVGCGLPPDSVGVFTLVMAVPLPPMPEAPVPEGALA